MRQKPISFIPVSDKKLIRGQAIWATIWILTTGIGMWLKPSADGFGTHRQLGLPPCPSVYLFGRYCPGCGLTTSFTLTLHSKVQEAFFANPFGPIFYSMLTIVGLVGGIAYLKGFYVDSSSKWINYYMIILTTSFIAFGLYRFIFQPIPENLLHHW